MDWLIGLGILGAYGWWLYKNRAVGVAALVVAPLLWLLLFIVVEVAEKKFSQNRTVGGYTHNIAWVSMNDNPHPENWQVEFANSYDPFWLALLAPLLCMLVLRVASRWQFRHFMRLAIAGYPMLVLTSFAINSTGSHEYQSQSELPPIGSHVDASGQLYSSPGNEP